MFQKYLKFWQEEAFKSVSFDSGEGRFVFCAVVLLAIITLCVCVFIFLLLSFVDLSISFRQLRILITFVFSASFLFALPYYLFHKESKQ